ncbi:MAG TPA: alpha-amylase family glycosyl hydrolase [Cyclobacteriaceae bacterium]
MKPVIYQLMVRLFGNTKSTNKIYGTLNENGVGKFNDITIKALGELKKLGITHIWYTGILEHAVLTDYSKYGIPEDYPEIVKGRAGSPYAVKDYYDVNPDLAVDVTNRMKEFEDLVQRTQMMGMKAIIDFVPNHVARNYRSDSKPKEVKDFGEDDSTEKAFDPQNNFYYLVNEKFIAPSDYNPPGKEILEKSYLEFPAKATGNDVFNAFPSVDDWFETVKLNYGIDYLNGKTRHFDPIPDTWLKMFDILKYWSDKGVDGFRCDMAEMVPVEFWEWLIPQIKDAYPESIFIAEIYNPMAYSNYINKGGFDYLYDKVEMYDTLRQIIQKSSTTDSITDVWKKQEGIYNSMLRFLENHDEQRIASSSFANDPFKALPALMISATLQNGPVMIYFGQEVGEPANGISGYSDDDGRTTVYDYWGVPEHQKWMNNGTFDGGKLSATQMCLRDSYQFILNLCKRSAVSSGQFYDLIHFNRNENYEGYNELVYAYLRYDENERLLIICNFNAIEKEIYLKIPTDAIEKMRLLKAKFNFKSLLNGSKLVAKFEEVTEYSGGDGLKVSISAYYFDIFEIT